MPTILTVNTLAGGRLDGPVGALIAISCASGIEAYPQHRADVQPHLLRGLRVHDRLVRIVGVGQPSRYQVGRVLGRVFTTSGTFEDRRLRARLDTEILAVDEIEVAVEPNNRVHAVHEWQPEDLGVRRRVVPDRPSN